MYGVPEQLNLAPLIGTTLDYIGVGKYQLYFVFSGDPWKSKDCRITVQGYWEMRDAGSVVIDKAAENDARDAYRIHRLLSRAVVGWRRHAERRQNRHVRSLRAGVAIRHRRTTAQFGTP
jgi:hypothetical protein